MGDTKTEEGRLALQLITGCSVDGEVDAAMVERVLVVVLASHCLALGVSPMGIMPQLLEAVEAASIAVPKGDA